MNEIINCFKENNPIINKKLKKVSVEEGLEIAKELLEILSDRKDAIGLAANQVGIMLLLQLLMFVNQLF